LQSVRLEGVPDLGAVFAGWTGDCEAQSDGSAIAVLGMAGSTKTCQAAFETLPDCDGAQPDVRIKVSQDRIETPPDRLERNADIKIEAEVVPFAPLDIEWRYQRSGDPDSAVSWETSVLAPNEDCEGCLWFQATNDAGEELYQDQQPALEFRVSYEISVRITYSHCERGVASEVDLAPALTILVDG
jgi:hypothetical protein